jgi:hypothetical protein
MGCLGPKAEKGDQEQAAMLPEGADFLTAQIHTGPGKTAMGVFTDRKKFQGLTAICYHPAFDHS